MQITTEVPSQYDANEVFLVSTLYGEWGKETKVFRVTGGKVNYYDPVAELKASSKINAIENHLKLHRELEETEFSKAAKVVLKAIEEINAPVDIYGKASGYTIKPQNGV